MPAASASAASTSARIARSERAILADVEAALTEAAGIPRRKSGAGGAKGQDSLL